MDSDTIIQLASLGLMAFFGWKVMNAAGAPYRGGSNFLGDIWNGLKTPFEDTYNGIGNVVNQLNPFTGAGPWPW